MSRTLNLVDILLTSGRNLVMMGRFTEALVPLTKLAQFRNLPEYVLQELLALRADIHLQQQDYKEARRQLAAAIALRPLDANNHYLMGIAIEEDLATEPKKIAFTATAVGKYPFYCIKKLLFFASHRERGMEGVLEVVP